MAYFTSNNTLNLVILIIIVVILLIIFTDVKKIEIFTDTTSTTAGSTTTTTEGSTTTTTEGSTTTTTEGSTTTTNSETTTTKYNFCNLIDQNIQEGKDKIEQGKEYLDVLSEENELEKCVVHTELELIDLLLINEMKKAGKEESDIFEFVNSRSMVRNFFKIVTTELENSLRETLINVSRRIIDDTSVEEDKVEIFEEIIDTGGSLDEDIIKNAVAYLRTYSNTRASVFTIDERTPIKKDCHDVPPFLKNMDLCNQYGYLISLEQNIIRDECKKCNSCDDDNQFLDYEEVVAKMDDNSCNEICNNRPAMSLPEYCQGGTSRSSNMPVNTQPNTTTTQAPRQTTSNTQSQTVQNSSSPTSAATTTTSPNRRQANPYAIGSLDISDYFNIEDIGKTISNNVGEVMTKLGYAGYNPELEETPIPRVYDNTVDYRALNQGLSNLETDEINRASQRINSSGGGGGANYSAPVVVQEDIQGVSNVFAPYIIFHNTGHEPQTNLGQQGGISSSTQRVDSSNGLNVDGQPIEEYLRGVM